MALRRIGSVLLIALGGIALVGGILARYADRNLLDPERFAERAVGVLDDEGAQAEVADVIVNELEHLGADRKMARRVVNQNINAVAQDERFRDALTAALIVANEQALAEDQEDVSVSVQDAGIALRDNLAARNPELAALIPDDISLPVANTGRTGVLVDVARAANDISAFALVLPIMGVAALIGGVIVANDRRTALFGAAMVVALAGVVIFTAYLGGREVAARTPDDAAAQDAAHAIWAAVFGGLKTLGLVTAAIGALVALIAGLATRARVPGRA